MNNLQQKNVLVWKITEGNHRLAYSRIEGDFQTLDEASAAIPAGVYTTLRTYQRTQVMQPDQHFQRLNESAGRIRPDFQGDCATIRPVLRELIHHSPFPESRVRITLDLEMKCGDLYVSIEALHTPSAAAYARGVTVSTRRMQRKNPQAKYTQFIATAAQSRADLPPGIHEVLMVDDQGYLLEGLSSNFFGVQRGVITTPATGVLPGITRGAVLRVAAEMQIPLLEAPIALAEVKHLEEAFITSASRAVLPVVQIDQIPIGLARPGAVTHQVMNSYAVWVKDNIEEI